MNRLRHGRCSRKPVRGAAMVEALLSFFVLFLILFGMIHVFYFFMGQFYADYASLRGARSKAVGFADYLANRAVRINAIGGSGMLVSPRLYSAEGGNAKYGATQFTMEKTLIQRYMVGASWLEYQYWFGVRGLAPLLNITLKDSGTDVKAAAEFSNYAFPWGTPETLTDSGGNPPRKTFRLFFDGINLKGSASLGNHSKIYLED